jgi:hypothetical protein
VIYSHTHIESLDIVVDITPPDVGPYSGATREPSIRVWPYGQQGKATPSMIFTADEAEELGQALLKAAREARELFPKG